MTLAEAFTIFVYLLPVIMATALAYWRDNPFLLIVAGSATMVIGNTLIDLYDTTPGVAIGIMVIAVGIATFLTPIAALYSKRKAKK